MTYSDLTQNVQGPDSAPPVLLLHGWGSSAQNMRPLADALSDAYRTYTIDLPGHGSSPAPPAPWGVHEHALLLRNYIESEIEARVTIIGHSNGGRIALYMASCDEFSPYVERLVLISPSGVKPERSIGYYVRSRLARALKWPIRVLPSPLREPAMDWLRHSLVWQLLGSRDYNELRGVMRKTFVKTVNQNLDDVLDEIDVPTLLFWGTEDEAVSRRQMDVLDTAIHDAGLVELDGAGHYGHVDNFDTVLSGTRHFLEQT